MLTADLIIDNLPGANKKQVFDALAGHAASLFFGPPEMVVGAMIDRERLGCTGIGAGCAIPHIKLRGLKKMYGVLARLRQPVDYASPDGKPVDLIFMLLVPEGDRTASHFKALAQIARFLRDPDICARLRTGDKNAISLTFTEWLKKQAA
jgi:PTS system nitrogen regulatory IIA component